MRIPKAYLIILKAGTLQFGRLSQLSIFFRSSRPIMDLQTIPAIRIRVSKHQSEKFRQNNWNMHIFRLSCTVYRSQGSSEVYLARISLR